MESITKKLINYVYTSTPGKEANGDELSNCIFLYSLLRLWEIWYKAHFLIVPHLPRTRADNVYTRTRKYTYI